MTAPRAFVLLLTAAACSRSSSGDTACVPLASVADQCPPDWPAAMTAKAAFCAQQAPFFDAFLSTAACRGRLHYTRYLFDGGPRYCVYDPVTLKLAGYGAYDGKAMFQQWSCGVPSAEFDDTGCAGDGCPAPADAATTDG